MEVIESVSDPLPTGIVTSFCAEIHSCVRVLATLCWLSVCRRICGPSHNLGCDHEMTKVGSANQTNPSSRRPTFGWERVPRCSLQS